MTVLEEYLDNSEINPRPAMPLPQILGILRASILASSGSGLDVLSLGLIGTLPGPAARDS